MGSDAPAVLAIDQGTSGTKAVVVDHCGAVLALAEVGLRPTYFDGNAVEQDPHALLDSVITAGRQALAAAKVPVAAVALANQGETVLAWDRKSGNPLSPAIVWQDGRSASVCEVLADHADEIAALTGLVLDPYFSAPKMRWLREQRTREGVVTTTDTWLIHQLTGEFVTDSSTASRSLLLDLDQASWSPRLLDLFGLGAEALPRVVASDEVVGTTKAFGAPLPVAGLIVDQQAALLAQSCWQPGMAKCTYGTGAFLLAQTGQDTPRSLAGLTTSVAWTLREQTSYCLDGQVYTAGSAVRWLTDIGLLGSAADLDRVAAADSGGVVCVPALAGLAAPWWDATATASISGLSLSSGPSQIVRAVLDGVAAQVAELTDLVAAETAEPVSCLRVDGGLTRSDVLMQAQADLSQTSLEVYPSPHATALGAAACARLAMDPGLSLADAVGQWQPARRYQPTWSSDRAEAFRARWREVAEHCRSQP
ncbi:MAG TPA: FGGY family carbohydrate kinase [Marmoricola sp.]|nr:FGGY family carbohydrate kinase [Marmoricola sp.]